MKCEIHSGVSSQLSAICDREAWLLDQVDRQCQLKVDALTTQGDSLQQSLGQLRGLLEVSEGHLEAGADHTEGVDSHIGHILERFVSNYSFWSHRMTNVYSSKNTQGCG